MGKVEVAFDEHELLDRLGKVEELTTRPSGEEYAQPELIAAVHAFIHAKHPGTHRQ